VRDRLARIARLQNAIALRQRHAAAQLDALEARLREICEAERGLLALTDAGLGGQTQFIRLLGRQLSSLAHERGELHANRDNMLRQWRSNKAAERSAGVFSGNLNVESQRADAARLLADWLEPRFNPGASSPTDS
jgi:hypothetical protein